MEQEDWLDIEKILIDWAEKEMYSASENDEIAITEEDIYEYEIGWTKG